MVFGLGNGEMWATALLGPVGLAIVGANRIANGLFEQTVFGAAPADEMALAQSVGKAESIRMLRSYQVYLQESAAKMDEGAQGRGFLRVAARVAAELVKTFIGIVRLSKEENPDVQSAQQLHAAVLALSEKSKEMYHADVKAKESFYAMCDELTITSSAMLQSMRARSLAV